MKYVINCILIGDSMCGKTTFCKTLDKEMNIKTESKTTIGVDILYKLFTINGNVFKVKFWDLSGVHRFIPILGTYLKTSNLVLLFFSYTNIESVKNLSIWNELIELHSFHNPKIYLIGSMANSKDTSISWSNSEELNELKAKFPYKLHEIECTDYKSVLKTITSILEDLHVLACNKLETNVDEGQDEDCLSNILSCINPFRKN